MKTTEIGTDPNLPSIEVIDVEKTHADAPHTPAGAFDERSDILPWRPGVGLKIGAAVVLAVLVIGILAQLKPDTQSGTNPTALASGIALAEPQNSQELQAQVRALYRLKLQEMMIPKGLGLLTGDPELNVQRADAMLIQVAERAGNIPAESVPALVNAVPPTKEATPALVKTVEATPASEKVEPVAAKIEPVAVKAEPVAPINNTDTIPTEQPPKTAESAPEPPAVDEAVAKQDEEEPLDAIGALAAFAEGHTVGPTLDAAVHGLSAPESSVESLPAAAALEVVSEEPEASDAVVLDDPVAAMPPEAEQVAAAELIAAEQTPTVEPVLVTEQTPAPEPVVAAEQTPTAAEQVAVEAPAAVAVAPDAGWEKHRGNLHLPLVKGRISQGFGVFKMSPDSRARVRHTGWTMRGPSGHRIRAAEEGVVVYAGFLNGYGLTVVLDHGDDVHTVYAHLKELHVLKGKTVGRGLPIGLVGSTGSLTGEKLYFELRHEGRPLNPEGWFRPAHQEKI